MVKRKRAHGESQAWGMLDLSTPGFVFKHRRDAFVVSQIKKFQETLAMYRQHEWRLARVLMCATTLAELRGQDAGDEGLRFENVPAEEAAFDAMWFTRAAQGGREAWELRLVADAPYALFELFEPDEEEEDRHEVRREMEARMREYAAPES